MIAHLTYAPAARNIAALSLATLLASMGMSIANVALPALAGAFSIPFQQAQWVVIAYMLGSTCFVVIAGRLGDRFGKRRLLLAAATVFALSSALAGMAPSLPWLIAARFLQGIAAAAMLSLGMALASQIARGENAGSVMGLMGTMSAVGTALGPSLGGLLVAGFGWRAVFLATVPVAAVAYGLATGLPGDKVVSSERGRADIPGTLLLVATLATYALAATVGHGQPGAINAALLAATVLGLAALITVEARSPSPILPPRLLQEPILATGLATSAVVSTVVMTTLVVAPFHLSGALHLSTAAIGMVMSVGPIVSALTGLPAGRMVDRFGTKGVSLAGLAAMAVAAAVLALLAGVPNVLGYVLPLVLLTAGYAAFQAANNTAVMRSAAAGEGGMLSGLLNLSRSLGLVSGASVMGMVFAMGAGGGDLGAASPALVAAGTRTAFTVAAGLVVAALLAAWRAGSPRRRVGEAI